METRRVNSLYVLSFIGLNLIDVQCSSEHRDGFSLIFSMLLDLVTVVMDPHSSPDEQRRIRDGAIGNDGVYIQMIVLHQKRTVYRHE